MNFGEKTLNEAGYKVDYVISHCLPQEIASTIGYIFINAWCWSIVYEMVSNAD